MIIPSIIEKFSFAAAAAVLLRKRVPTLVLAFAAIDFVLGVLFLVAYLHLGKSPPV